MSGPLLLHIHAAFILMLTVSTTTAHAAEIPLDLGMTRETVLMLRGRPKIKVEMETSRIEKWFFNPYVAVVFKNGIVIGEQHFKEPGSTPQKIKTPQTSTMQQRKKTHTVTSAESAAIFKEIEGISEPDGPTPGSPTTQSPRRQIPPQPGRPGTDDSGDEDIGE